MSDPVRLVQVGAGAMGRAWLSTIAAEPGAEIVGLVDLDPEIATAALAATGTAAAGVVVGTDVVEVARSSGADAVVDVTAPVAHHPVTTAALRAGLPVLGEKPAAETVAQALSLVAATRLAGVPFVVSQSRRYNPQAFVYREQVRALGSVGQLTTEFFKAPHFGGFREEMPHPLLVDMAIHQLDLARFLLDADPVSVYCESFNPTWSWYDGAAAAVATVTMSTGARYSFTGSWCAPGFETSWNGSWRASGERGSALWSGDDDPVIEAEGADVGDAPTVSEGLAGSLAAFVAQLRGGPASMCDIADNVLSLAMVEAAVASAESGARVLIDDVLTRAQADAVAAETADDVRAVLTAGSVRELLQNR